MDKKYPLSDFDFVKRPVSYSSLKHMLKSPLHFAYNRMHRKPPTDAMIFGNLLDCLLLEPETYQDRYVIMPEINRRTNVGKEEYAALMEEMAKNKTTAVKQEDVERAKLIVETIKTNPKTKWLYEATTSVQKKLVWIDKKTGLEVIGYLDGEAEKETKPIIWDLKGTTDASQDAWERQAFNMGYHLQAGTYWTGYARKTGKFADFYHVVVEFNEPFAVNCFLADSDFMELGKKHFRQSLDRVKYCIDNDCFDMGYEFLDDKGYSVLSLPGWAKKQLD